LTVFSGVEKESVGLTVACCCDAVRVLQSGGVTRMIVAAGVKNACARKKMRPRKHAHLI